MLAGGALAAILTLATIVPPPIVASLPGFHAAWVGQDPWPTLAGGAQASYSFLYRNTGSESWDKGVPGRQVNLGVTGDDRSFSDLGLAVGWLAPDRPATATEAHVPPGGIGTFTFTLRAPLGQGVYRIPVHPVLEGVAHLEDEGAYLVVVSDSGFHSRWVSQSAYPAVQPGDTTPPITITFRNAGSRAWTKGDPASTVRLGINGDDRSQGFLNAGWPLADRVAEQTEASVAPGALASFTFRMKAPVSGGVFQLHLRPVIDGVSWLEDEGVYMAVTARSNRAPVLAASLVQQGLDGPWDIAFAPDGRMFVTEKSGTIVVFASGAPGAPVLVRNPIANIRPEGEGGAMGIALDPAFASNGFVYVCASRDDPGFVNQVLRYRASGSALSLDGYVIRTGMYAGGNHDGCRIRFGPDGKLWVTMGEVGNPPFSQDPNSLNGKILRVNPDGSVPADNPIMPGASGRSVVYTMGHRNPQGIAFQPGTGQAYNIEHSHYSNHTTHVDSHATVNRLVPGGNYSWPYGSGPGFIAPVWESHNNPYVATSGGSFVADPRWGAWSGNLFIGALAGEMLLRLAPNPDGTFATADTLYVQQYGRLRGVTEGPNGSLFVSGDNGIILRIDPN